MSNDLKDHEHKITVCLSYAVKYIRKKGLNSEEREEDNASKAR
jgi:hypothetical protein